MCSLLTLFKWLGIFCLLLLTWDYLCSSSVSSLTLHTTQPSSFPLSSLSTVPSLTRRISLPRSLLFCRAWAGDGDDLQQALLQSMTLFWNTSTYGPLLLVLDQDSVDDRALGNQLQARYDPSFLRVVYEEPFDSDFYHGVGHAKQQLSQFWADTLLTRAATHFPDLDLVEYIGFVDADSLLITPHIAANSWNVTTGQPVILVRLDTELRYTWYLEARKNTFRALQLPEAGRCMSYFPFYIHRRHLHMMRSYMERVHGGLAFVKVFQLFSEGDIFSQFNIMCTYLWYFHREEYEWRYWKTSAGEVILDQPEAIRDMTFLSPESTRPWARSMVHYRHHHENDVSLQVYLREGICHTVWNVYLASLSPGNNNNNDTSLLLWTQEHCAFPETKSRMLDHLFDFEQATWRWDPRVHATYAQHFQDVLSQRIHLEPFLLPRLLRAVEKWRNLES